MTVNIPSGDTNTYNVSVNIGWTNSGTTTQGSQISDYDLYIYQPDVTGTQVAKSASSSNPEVATFTAASGNYTIYVVPYDVSPTVAFNGTITLKQVVQPTATPTPTPVATPTPLPTTPRFFNYADPYNHQWGEPSLGVNFKTGRVMYISSLHTLGVTFDDSTSPAMANWADKSFLSTSVITWDPILYTDSQVGRTFVSQLVTGSQGLGLGCSLTAYTDDDGDSWVQSEGCGLPTSGADHQSVGGGSYAPPLAGTAAYPKVVYYCSQAQAAAFCARSDDGGVTFGPGVPIYNLTECVGIHGHVKVAPDGTVYVPNRNCGGQQGIAVSKDNGITWTLTKNPNSHSSSWDPAVGVGSDGTIYFGYSDNNSTPRMAIYNPATDAWSNDQPAGGPFSFTGVAFPAVVSGDGDRAALAFLGTTTPGTPFGSGTDFTGDWHLYVATTFDRGASYALTDATPGDPVQRGNICDGGSGCTGNYGSIPFTRNLLDFMDVQIDQKGRILVGYADGCVTAACIQGKDVNGPGGKPDGVVDSYDNDGQALSTIARQSGGRGLLSRYDAELMRTTPAAPQLVASTNGQTTNLTWSTPDGGGSPITGYNIYRAVGSGANTLIAGVGGDINSYTDNSNGANNYYSVQAVNANGAGVMSPRVQPTPLETPCVLPGLTVATDLSDALPNSPPVPQVDLRSVHIGEPYLNGAQKMVFTLNLAGGGALPPNSQWYIIWYRPNPDANYSRDYVAMKTDVAGTPSFEYGRINYPLVYTAPQSNQGNIPTRLGNADAGSYDSANGTVQITVTRGLLDTDDNIGIGKTITSIEARSFFGRNDGLPINQNLSSDYTATGNYTVVGNDACLQPPAAPTNLTASSRLKRVIALNWTDNSSDETGFSIERSTSINSGFAEIATVGANVTTYTDQSVARRITYYYRVRAFNGKKSGYSNIAGGRAR